jgi:flagellin-like protein
MNVAMRYRRNDRGVSPVIGEVLMVAITIMLAVIVWLIVTSMVSDPDEEKVVVKLNTPKVQQVTRNGTVVWDATLDILTLTLKDEKVYWHDVLVFVKSDNGSILHPASNMSDDSLGTYDEIAPIDCEFWFVEITSGDTKMSAGDSIKITGMDREYEGATVQLMLANELIGSIDVMAVFP